MHSFFITDTPPTKVFPLKAPTWKELISVSPGNLHKLGSKLFLSILLLKLRRSSDLTIFNERFNYIKFNLKLLVKQAGVAQLVERQPSKLNVAGSNPVSRSIIL